jgi:hypothetical protein
VAAKDTFIERKEDLYEVNPFIPKLSYSMQGERITAFDFVTLKPVGRSPSGAYQSSFVAVALESGIVKVFDTFLGRSLLFEFAVQGTNEILQVTSSTLSDDMFLAVLTKEGLIYLYDVTLERRVKLNTQREALDENEASNGGNSESNIGSIKKDKKGSQNKKNEESSGNKYQQMLKQY